MAAQHPERGPAGGSFARNAVPPVHVLALVGVVALVALPLAVAAASLTGPEPIAVPALHDDIETASRILAEVHPELFRSPRKLTALQDRTATLIETTVEPLTRTELFWRLAPLVGGIGDGHTTLEVPWTDVTEYLEGDGLVFPLDLLLIEGAAYVDRDYSERSGVPRGSRVLAINDVPIATLIEETTAVLSGRSSWRRRRLDGRSDFFKALLWLGRDWRGPFRIRWERGGDIEETTLAGVTRATLRAARAESASSSSEVRFRRIGSQAALLRIPAFEDAPELRRSLDDAVDAWKRERPGALIVDVRGNPGGDSGAAELVLSHLVDQPAPLVLGVQARASEAFKTQMKQRIPGVLRWFPAHKLSHAGRAIWNADEGGLVPVDTSPVELQRQARRWQGRLVVLIDEGTFSTAAIFAAAIRRLGRGTLIGRPTGGVGGVMAAEPLHFELPHSGLVLRVSSMRFQLAEDDRITAAGVEPDVFVERRLDDELAGEDTILRAALPAAGDEPDDQFSADGQRRVVRVRVERVH
jgi:hypothetical protein